MTAHTAERHMRDAPRALPVTAGPAHHWFGYYDKTPWDATGRYMLGMEVGFINRPPAADDAIELGLIDTEDGNAWRPFAKTTAWNWQQGTMLQWSGAAPDRLVVYNMRGEGRYEGEQRDVLAGDARRLPLPVYALSPDGRTALSTNFARIADTRPGYGYEGIPDSWKDEDHPAEDGIYAMDVGTGESELIVSLDRVARTGSDASMDGAKHWFNHIQVNGDGTRFAFLHRWRRLGERGWSTRLFTAGFDGSDLCCLSDHGLVSHYDWLGSDRVLAWARREGIGDRYFLFSDQSDELEVVADGALTRDGHCSWSPDGRWILTDEYPDAQHRRPLLLYRPEDDRLVELGRFYSPPEMTGRLRCDLHPRWSRDGARMCLDSAHEGGRQMYAMDVSDLTGEAP
jgi:hypothetical protein